MAAGKVFAPLLVMMDLSGKRRTDRLRLDLGELASQTYFARSAATSETLSARQATGGAVHRAVAAMAALLAPNGVLGPAVPQADVVILDGTGVRAGPLCLGAACHMAIGLVSGSGPARRRRAMPSCWG